MAAGSLLTLLDDIATVLDDIAVLSKVAAKKTAGVLGDDLALNAEQVSGVRANREIPVVWAVAKGSFLNKLILVPAALLISLFIPVLVNVLLVIGGLYLCFEGAEKVIHAWQHRKQTEHDAGDTAKKLSLSEQDLLALERTKIKGAIRTDFVLSAEIIVIILGTLQTEPLTTQILVLSGLAIAFTVGVYGLVAMIVKLDDVGLLLLRKSLTGSWNGIQRFFGRLLLSFAPILMKSLSIIGTIAMFLVGGGILTHNVAWIHHVIMPLEAIADELPGGIELLLAVTTEGIVGLIGGCVVLLSVVSLKKLRT